MRFSDSVTETTVGKTVTIDEFRTRIFYPLIDFCINEMDRRFSEQNKIIMKGISALTPGNTHFLDWKLIKPFAEIYGCNLEYLELEIKNMSRLISRKQEADVPKGLLDFCNLATRLRDAFFELHRLLVISCVLSRVNRIVGTFLQYFTYHKELFTYCDQCLEYRQNERSPLI